MAPVDQPRVRPATPQPMFDRVAPWYDRVNGLLTLGADRRWRRTLAREVAQDQPAAVLDVGTGTGALLRQLQRVAPPGSRLVGCDLNRAMLRVAAERTGATGGAVAGFSRCDARRLPFRSHSFDAVTMAFAIDDVTDREACARELARVLRPGGVLGLLELSLPQRPWLRSVYRAALSTFGVLGRGSRMRGLAHLREEILAYRGPEAIGELLAPGFDDHRWRPLSAGLATLHLARRRDDGTAREGDDGLQG